MTSRTEQRLANRCDVPAKIDGFGLIYAPTSANLKETHQFLGSYPVKGLRQSALNSPKGLVGLIQQKIITFDYFTSSILLLIDTMQTLK
jgi:hypothetical protein